MAKRRDLIKALRSTAKQACIEFSFVRNGSNHDIYRWDTVLIVIPRHNEINEMTARGIIKDTDAYLKGGRP